MKSHPLPGPQAETIAPAPRSFAARFRLLVAGLLLAFAAGLCCGAFFVAPVTAQQQPAIRAGQEARDSFLQGGNTQVAVLRELLSATRENQARLEAIERNTGAMVELLSRVRPGQ